MSRIYRHVEENYPKYGIMFWANSAKMATGMSAKVKDWRLRTKKDRALKKLAEELSAGKGYIIATTVEISERYPELVGNNFTGGVRENRKFIWCIRPFKGGHKRKTELEFFSLR